MSHMRIKKANCLKDKMDSRSLNSSNANLVESAVPINRDRFKGKSKENQKPSYPKQQNKFSNKIQQPKGCAMPVASRGTKHTSAPFTKSSHSQTGSL